MKRMTKIEIKEQIRHFQSLYNLTHLQGLIDNGQCWKMEGYVGRIAMDSLIIGSTYLPNNVYYDYYGNKIPAQREVKSGTTGSFDNCVKHWSNRTPHMLP